MTDIDAIAVSTGGDNEEQSRPDPSDARKKLVEQKADLIRRAKKYWEKDFKRMRDNMAFARGIQWPDQSDIDTDKYVANLIKRHIKQRVAALYARDPKAIAKRRDRLTFEVWDGDSEKAVNAFKRVQLAQQNGIQPPPDDLKLVQDIEQGKQKRKKRDDTAKTLEMLFANEIREQTPNFKMQMKQAVRRAITTGVAYAKVDFQRELDSNPNMDSSIYDSSQQLSSLRQQTEDVFDGGPPDTDSPEFEELKTTAGTLAQQQATILREGLVFSFPQSTRIIPDPQTRLLKGFVGADWVAEEFHMTPDKIKQIYGVDVGDKFTARENDKDSSDEKPSPDPQNAENSGKDNKTGTVWELYDRQNGVMYTILDGFDDFLTEPGPPDVQVEGFFPYHVLMFNDDEDEGNIFPISEVEKLKDIQREYNRARQGLREHRQAAAPAYATEAGVLSEEDKQLLETHEPHAVLELRAMNDKNVQEVLQQIPKAAIDPNLYETSTFFSDFQRISGSNEAVLGSLSGASATETSIAEQSRVSDIQSDADELELFLSMLMKDAGHIMMQEFSEEQVKQKVGPGAVWPEFSMQEIISDIFLEVEAGSSGRPDVSQKAARLERVMPFLMQIPGIDREFVLRHLVQVIDDSIDVKDAIAHGLPSIMNENRQPQVSTGDLQNDPSNQGQQGGDNQQKSQVTPGGGQPQFPVDNSGDNTI